MAVSKSNKKSYISVPSQIINSISQSSLDSLLHPPKNKQSSSSSKLWVFFKSSRFFISLIFLLGFLWMMKMLLNFDPSMPFPQFPCSVSEENAVISNGASISELNNDAKAAEINGDDSEFWKHPDGMGYMPCLDFGDSYRIESSVIVKDRAKYLMVVVAGGMNQQRNQIVDVVVIARILGAALVVPILQKNVIWGNESEFGDIFDLDCFKRVLANDVRIVSSLSSRGSFTREGERCTGGLIRAFVFSSKLVDPPAITVSQRSLGPFSATAGLQRSLVALSARCGSASAGV